MDSNAELLRFIFQKAEPTSSVNNKTIHKFKLIKTRFQFNNIIQQFHCLAQQLYLDPSNTFPYVVIESRIVISK